MSIVEDRCRNKVTPDLDKEWNIKAPGIMILFKSLCPVGILEKEWGDSRMEWLGTQFGWERARKQKVILPSMEQAEL